MASVAEVLDRAADLIEPEGAWTKGALARGKSGKAVEERGRAAVCWCADGALVRIANYTGPYWPARGFLLRALASKTSVAFWNDAPERTQVEVVAKLREAAELARGLGQ